MDFVLENKKNRHLIILVHGLNGSESTWKGEDQRFVENLTKENYVKDNFDLALYVYGTKIIEISWFARIIRLLRGLINNKAKEDAKRFNVGIEKVSMPLVGQLNGYHEKYETISFISHSMGGLVTKSALTWLDSEILEKVYFFMSLSVPHIGAHLATLGAKIPVIGKNPQIMELKSMGKFTTLLNQRYGSIKIQPKIVYQWGIQDDVVPQPSAYPAHIPNNLTIATQDDHFSVVLIKNKRINVVYKRIMEELNIVTLPFLEIEADIPEGISFKVFIESILRSKRFNGIRIDFEGFTNKELNIELRESKIKSKSLVDFLIEIGELSINKMPKYIVEREKRTYNFTIKSIKNE